MNDLIELSNLEINEYCILNKMTGAMNFSTSKKLKEFTGSYFKDNNNFFAIYPTKYGPKIYYSGKEYSIEKNLTITLQSKGKNRTFKILEYSIEINYIESPFIGIDVWSDEADVDLFYMIEQCYKEDSFYDKFTLKL